MKKAISVTLLALLLEKNSEAALQSLEDAKTNLRQAYGTADTLWLGRPNFI